MSRLHDIKTGKKKKYSIVKIEIQAHIIFKRLKACAFNVEVYKQRFGKLTDSDKSNYNKFYGGYFKI